MKKLALVLCVCMLVMLCGCHRAEPISTTPPGRVVVQIRVLYQNGNLQTYREYSSTEKMRAILNYLRWIDPYGTPKEDPEAVEGSLFRIEMVFSDDSRKVYLQKADRYMLVEGHGWKYIDPQNAMTLGTMLGKMKATDSSSKLGSSAKK